MFIIVQCDLCTVKWHEKARKPDLSPYHLSFFKKSFSHGSLFLVLFHFYLGHWSTILGRCRKILVRFLRPFLLPLSSLSPELLNPDKEKKREGSLACHSWEMSAHWKWMEHAAVWSQEGVRGLFYDQDEFIFIKQMYRGLARLHNISTAIRSPFLLLICLSKWVLLNSVGVFQLDKRQFMSPAASMLH